ncbi:Oligoendopeptidase F homolog [Syntrophaceticus schinkii]|uniref:Oligopeptidase F n=1 Tax=Syntrophaceticus schinkii TaxID=499207 RepID=A0A0B7MDG3_9FIRM|nr:Oligoendopeptidase F homolog [Syntrophaceticus schinkii]
MIVLEKDRWNLEDIYQNQDEWEKDFGKVEMLLSEAGEFQVRLGECADSFFGALHLSAQIQELIVKVHSYARMKLDEDNANPLAQALFGRAAALLTRVETALSFITPEILSLPEGTVSNFRHDSRFALYCHYLDDVFRQKPHTLTGIEEQLVARTGEITRTPDDFFKMLNNADLTFPKIRDDQENEVEVTKGNFIKLMQNRNRRVRYEAFQALYGTYQKLENTFASALNAAIKRDIFYASVRRHQSARSAALFADHIPSAVYDSLVQTVRSNLGEMHRYMKLRKKILGLDQLYMYDIYVPLAEDVKWVIPFPDAVAMLKNGVAVMGDSYLEILSRGLGSRWVDLYERKGKTGGAYCDSIYGVHPFLLLNYQNNLDSAFTLAHEMGHALHFYYSSQEQPFIYSHPAIFTAEVASTVHESLLMEHLLQTTSDRDERDKKIYLLNYYLEIFRGTLFRQTMFAEFEKIIHEKAENGEALTSYFLKEAYHELNTAYHGEGMVVDAEIDMEWARIPHFYDAFYVYKYATGLSAAVSLVQQILTKGTPAVERYLSFLNKGGSDYPLNLLQEAGVDMASPHPVQDAINRFSGLLDELEALSGVG